MNKLCPFRKEIVKEESISLAVTVTRIKTDFADCRGTTCPYFNHNWGEKSEKYCIKVKRELEK